MAVYACMDEHVPLNCSLGVSPWHAASVAALTYRWKSYGLRDYSPRERNPGLASHTHIVTWTPDFMLRTPRFAGHCCVGV